MKDSAIGEAAVWRAALDSGGAARDAWALARTRLDLDNLPETVFPLLPKLYLNLRALGLDDAWRPRLKGVYRQVWSGNQLRLPYFAQAAEILGQAVLLPGPAWLAQYYGDAGLCAVNRCDVWMEHPPDINALLAAGWSPGDTGADWATFHRHAENAMLRCHWWRWNDLTTEAGAAAAPLGGAWRILSPTDSLLYLAGGAAADVWAGWLAWAAWQSGRIDWPRLAAAIRKPTEAKRLLETFAWLKADVPPAALASLRYQAAGGAQAGVGPRVRRAWQLLWQDYTEKDNLRGYLKQRWGLASVWQIPAAAASRFWRWRKT